MSSFKSSHTREVYKVHSLFIPYPALWTTNTCQFLFKLWKSSYNNFHQNSVSLLHMIIELQTHRVTLSQQTERSVWRCEKIWVLSGISYSVLCRRCWYRSPCHSNEAEKHDGFQMETILTHTVAEICQVQHISLNVALLAWHFTPSLSRWGNGMVCISDYWKRAPLLLHLLA